MKEKAGKKEAKGIQRKQDSFQITGKVTTEEKGQSVSGLKVMAYIAGTKRLVGTAITDEDGSYRIEFEYHEPVDVDISVCPDVEDKVLRVIPKARYTISKDAWAKRSPFYAEAADITIAAPLWVLWERICKEYTVFGLVVQGIPDPDNPGSYLDLIPIPDATVHVYDVSPWWIWIWPPPPVPPFTQYEIGTATTDANGLFMFEFDWCYTLPYIHPWWLPPFPDIKPDILFKVSQTVNGVEVPIYEEDPASETRWNIDELPPLGVTLIVEGDVVLPDDPITPIAGDFEFHGIGRVLISQMDSEGYADTSGPGDIVKAKDSPFGSAIDIKGQFNNALSGKYYQVLYAKWASDTTPPVPADFTPILDEVWPIAQKVGANWVTVQKSPVSLPGVGDGCYEIPDYTDLFTTSKEILIRWRTHRKDLGAPRYPNGKYSLMVKAYESDGSPVGLPAGGGTALVVRIDNTWPVANIKEDITTSGGTVPPCPDPRPPGMVCDNPEVCGIIYIESGKTVRIRFDAYDDQDHFRRYNLTYRTGHAVTGSIASKGFIGPPREDHGFTNEMVDWAIAGLSQCGYEVRLVVWDRTINGYHHIHWSEDFIHLILLEKPVP